MAKKRSLIFERILGKETPAEVEERRQRRLANIKSMTMEYQLGWFVGEEIVRRYLPTLEVDMIQTRNVIKVDPAEKAECERLDKVWFEKSQSLGQEGSSVEWKELRAYHEMLEAKYLPPTVSCIIQPVNYVDEEQFKLGIVRALWDSDLCHYKCSNPSDVEVNLDEDGYYTEIILKR